MPTVITCSCGKKLAIPDHLAMRKIACPACRTVLVAPAAAGPKPEGPAAPPAAKTVPMEVIVEPTPAPAKKGGPAAPPASKNDPVEVLVEPEDLDKAERKRKRDARARRRGLDRVNLSLAFHYAAIFLVYAGLWAMIIAVNLNVAYRYSDSDKTRSAMTFFYFAAATCILLTGLVHLVIFILCLALPDGSARKFLIGSHAAWLVVFGLAIWALCSFDLRLPALGGAVLFLLGSWALWMFFLRRTASVSGQRDIADECVPVLWRGLATMLALVVILTLITLYVMLVMSFKFAWVRFVIFFFSLSILMGVMRIAAATRFFESFTHALLFPTGFLSVLRYLDLVGSLRMNIHRRS
jgi:hypothetical protein